MLGERIREKYGPLLVLLLRVQWILGAKNPGHPACDLQYALLHQCFRHAERAS